MRYRSRSICRYATNKVSTTCRKCCWRTVNEKNAITLVWIGKEPILVEKEFINMLEAAGALVEKSRARLDCSTWSEMRKADLDNLLYRRGGVQQPQVCIFRKKWRGSRPGNNHTGDDGKINHV